MGKVIAITNQKGGVGKTTTSVNLAASLAASGQKVLLIDFDSQGNATMGCGINKHEVEYISGHLLLQGVLEQPINIRSMLITPACGNFQLIPSSAELTAAEVALMESSVAERERQLQKAIKPLLHDYQFILIDCPPALNILTMNALVAAQGVLIPMQCEYYALEGLAALLETISQVQATINPELKIEGILRTMYDARNNLANDVSSQLQAHFGAQLYQTVIPRNVRLAEAPSHGMPIIYYDKSSRGALAYLELALEIIQRQPRAKTPMRRAHTAVKEA